MCQRALARYRFYFPRSTSADVVGPLKNHQSGPPNFSSCASPLRGSAQCWLLRLRRVPWQPRTRQHTRATTPTDAARKVQRRMLGRVSVGRDTLLRGGFGDSPGVARQVRPREGDHLPQGSSHTRTHTPTRQRGPPPPPLPPFFFCSALVRRRLADRPFTHTGLRMRQYLPLLLLARV